MGKGRRERVLPLWKETTAALKAWLAVRPASGDAELFLNAMGRAMTRAGFEYILAKHAAPAAQKLPSLADKRITPHVLRHTCAMHTLKATRDVRKVSLWLGHASLQSTEIYLRADPTEKLGGACRDGAAVAQARSLCCSRQAPRDAEVHRTIDKLYRVIPLSNTAGGKQLPRRTPHNCTLHIIAHVAVTTRDPHPHPGTDRNHLIARIIAAARSQGAAEPILTFTPFGKSTAMASSTASLLAGSASLAGTKAGSACWTKACRRQV